MILLPALAAALVLAQAGAAEPPPPPAATMTASEARLSVCLDQARTDPPTAIVAASAWASEVTGVDASLPQQCLGFAYMSLLRWDAAEQAFIAARDARAESDGAARARLGAMAGNAALAGGDFAGALEPLSAAQADAEAAGLNEVAGGIAADRARALVGAGREAEAAEVLTGAQILAPQVADVWLLSATLARRQGDLSRARDLIGTAVALEPQSQEIGLELGLVAALSGDEVSARTAWTAVTALDEASPHAEAARAYLAQLDEGTPPQ
jgi:tetratricopeptide (TPR) repeat protein